MFCGGGAAAAAATAAATAAIELLLGASEAAKSELILHRKCGIRCQMCPSVWEPKRHGMTWPGAG